MTETPEQIDVRLRTENPELVDYIRGEDGGKRVVRIGPEDAAYDARIAEMVAADLATQAGTEVRVQQVDRSRQAKLAIATLAANLTRLTDGQAMSAAQMRPMITDLTRITIGVIRVLQDHDLVERND